MTRPAPDLDPEAFRALLERAADIAAAHWARFVTGTVLDGRFTLRGCVTNFRSTGEDARHCVETVVELGERLEAETAAR